MTGLMDKVKGAVSGNHSSSSNTSSTGPQGQYSNTTTDTYKGNYTDSANPQATNTGILGSNEQNSYESHEPNPLNDPNYRTGTQVHGHHGHHGHHHGKGYNDADRANNYRDVDQPGAQNTGILGSNNANSYESNLGGPTGGYQGQTGLGQNQGLGNQGLTGANQNSSSTSEGNATGLGGVTKSTGEAGPGYSTSTTTAHSGPQIGGSNSGTTTGSNPLGGNYSNSTGTGTDQPVHNSNMMNKLDPRVDANSAQAQQYANQGSNMNQPGRAI